MILIVEVFFCRYFHFVLLDKLTCIIVALATSLTRTRNMTNTQFFLPYKKVHLVMETRGTEKYGVWFGMGNTCEVYKTLKVPTKCNAIFVINIDTITISHLVHSFLFRTWALEFVTRRCLL